MRSLRFRNGECEECNNLQIENNVLRFVLKNEVAHFELLRVQRLNHSLFIHAQIEWKTIELIAVFYFAEITDLHY